MSSIENKDYLDGHVDMVEDQNAFPSEKTDRRQLEEFVEQEKHESLWAAAKAHKRILFYCIVPYMCGMTYGYDVIVNGATVAMPAFLLSFGAVDATGALYAPSIWTSLWISMTNLGQAIGSAFAGIIAQRIGRRYAMMIYAAISIAGCAIMYNSDSRGMLLAGKIINGFSVGGLLAVGTTWASDVAPLSLRGPIQQGLVFFAVVMQGTSLGIVRAFVPNIKPIAWKTAFAIQFVVGGLPLLAFFIPESPVWLLSKNKREQALKSLSRLYGKDNNLELRLELIQETLDLEKKNQSEGSASFIECFKGSNLLRTATVCILFFGSSGLIGSAFLSQNIYFLLTAGLPAIHSFDIGIGGFFLACIAIALMWFVTDKVGRRTLWLIGCGGNFIGMVIIGALGFATSKGALWGIAVMMNLLISFQVATCFNISWTMAPELSSYRLRQHTQSIGYIVQALGSWLFQFVVPYMYNVDAGNLGAKTGFVFAGTTVLLFVITWFMVPETLGLTIEDIDLAYEDKLSPRKFSERRAV